MISRIRAQLDKQCSVRKSPYCDHIIAMRIQGVPYKDIEKFLAEQGPQHRIPTATIWRNFQTAKLRVNVSYAVEEAERWGGSPKDLDIALETASQVLAQRRRIDDLVKAELIKKKANPNFNDKRIRAEMETLNNLIRTYFSMLKSPMEAAEERAKADQMMNGVNPKTLLSEDGEKLIAEMILNGEIKIGGDGDHAPTKLVQ